MTCKEAVMVCVCVCVCVWKPYNKGEINMGKYRLHERKKYGENNKLHEEKIYIYIEMPSYEELQKKKKNRSIIHY